MIATIYPISDSESELLLREARIAVGIRRGSQFGAAVEVVDLAERLLEGATTEIRVNAYERNPRARRACLNHYGTICFVCGVDLGKVYGRIADGFIHVHHTVPLSSIRKQYRVDPVKDLRPLCPNCHAVVHLSDSPRSVDDLRKTVRKKRFLKGIRAVADRAAQT